MTAHSTAANHASIARRATKWVASVVEDDARSTSASSVQGDGGSDIHATSSDEEKETTKVTEDQRQKVLANVPWRRGQQWRMHAGSGGSEFRQQQQQQEESNISNKVEKPCAPPGLQRATVGSRTSTFQPPPGLPPPPGFIEPPPGLATAGKDDGPTAFEYTVRAFRRELANIMRELRLHKNAGLAVSQVRNCGVPRDRQASEFADILTRTAEETRGPARRTCMAFVGGLTKAFEKEECIAGLRMFFNEVYPDLSTEVPRLRNIVMTELVPTLKAVLEEAELNTLQPSLLDAVGLYAYAV